MFFGIPACTFLLIAIAVSAGADVISVSVCLYSLLEASSVICRDPSHSDNALISFVLLELVLVPLHSLYYMCFISSTGNSV